MQKSTGGASPYPKSVIGNDEGGFARTWRTKTYSGREKGGSKTSCNPKPTDQYSYEYRIYFIYFSFIVSLYVSDLPNVTISTVYRNYE